MVCASILVNDNMVVTQMAYLVINVTENYVSNVIYEIWHIKRLHQYMLIAYMTLF